MVTKKIITKCSFKTKTDNNSLYSVAFNELTSGEVLALIRALMLARTVSPVAQDLSDYLLYALVRTIATGEKPVVDKAEEFVKELNGDMGLAFIRRDDLELMRAELKELRKPIRVDVQEAMRKELREKLAKK